MELFDVEMLMEEQDRVDGQLVYRLQCELYDSIGQKQPPLLLDLWCFEESEAGYVMGFRITGENVVRPELLFLYVIVLGSE